jgi:tungstate transport system permease protein
MAQTPSYAHQFLYGLQEGLHLIVTGNPVILDTTLRTLQLAAVATAVGALVGLPCGCLLGLGRSRGSRLALGTAGAIARVPPVAVGVLTVLLLTEASPWGGGPLAGLHWYTSRQSGYLAQALLAAPIVTMLTASAVARVPTELLDQARAYGARAWRRWALALRQARRSVLAGVIAVLGVTITSIGALVVATASADVNSRGQTGAQPLTLALGAFHAVNETQLGQATATQTPALTVPTQALAVAYATVLLGLFVLVAALLTWLQQRRRPLLAGIVS